MNPDPLIQRAAPVRRSRYRSLPQRPLSVTPATHSLQMTPPLTPSALTDKMAPMFEDRETAPEYFEDDDAEAPVFQNYLRAFYHFHPTTPVSSVSEESSITIPINQGDVILVHSIQPNGWADGTLLQSGARGWLPTNYCEPYDHEHIRTLLNALTYVWEFLRGFDGSDVSVLAKQDYVRGLIAGVRVLFERTGCLNRDSPLVVRHVGLRRLRKSLLGDLSAFVKSAKHLVAVCHAEGLTSEGLTRSLDDIVLKAQKAVTRAVKFLDVWTQDVHMKEVIGDQPHYLQQQTQQQPTHSITTVDGRLSTGASMLPLTPPAEGALLTQSPTSPDAAKGPNSLLVLADYAAKDGSPTTNAGSTEIVSQPILTDSATDPGSPGATLNEPTASSSSSRRFSKTSITPNSNSSRPASFVPKRGSIGYRWSTHGSRKLISPNHVLASEQLGKAHDAFLGCLGAYIGLHLQSRCSIELLVTTQQSVIACQNLIAVVDEVWERDSRRSDELDQARENMHFKLTALVQATRDIFGAAANDEREVFLPDQGKQLVDAATLCVRGAGECVAKTRSVIERIGDFEFEQGAQVAPEEQAASPFPDSQSPSLQDTSETIPEEQPQQMHSREPSRASDYSYSSAGATVVQASTPARPQSFIPAPPNSAQATPEANRTTPTPSSTVTASVGLLTPQAAANSDSVAPPRTSSLEPIPSTVAVGDMFQIDFPNPPSLDLTLPSGGGSLDGKERPGSLSNSMTDTNSTYHSSFRHSETSLASQGSTQMTSSDEAESNDNHLTASFGNLSDAGHNTNEETDEAEAQLLTKTYAHELTFNKEGQITGGSLPALVERLTTHDSTPDAFFVNTFYLTFRLFTTPREFAQALSARFDDAGEAKEIGGPIRLRVYNVMKGWLESHWRMDADTEAFDTIVSFANTKLKAYLPSASKRVLELVDKAADPKEASAAAAARKMSILGRTSTPSPTFPNSDAMASMPVVNKSQLNLLKQFNSKSAAKTSILDFDALELARQLTIIESRMFCSIQAEELLASEWMRKSSAKASNVRSMSTFSTDLSNLIADTVLVHEEAKKRALVLRQWIKVAKKCLELNNYDTLMAIICSLDSSMVGRLNKTWALVPAKNMTKLEELRRVVDVSKNYAALRQAHQSQVAPCLPFVGIYLTDLTFIDVGNQGMRQLSTDGPEVINFDKHVKTAKIIGDLQRFQVPYPLTPVPEIQDWIMAQITRVNESGDANVTAWYRRSCMLEPREPQLPRAMSVVDTTSAAVEKTTTREKFEFWSNLHFPSNNKSNAAMAAATTPTTP